MIKRIILRSLVSYFSLSRRYSGSQGNYDDPEEWEMEIGPKGSLVIRGCDVVHLAQEYGTPLFIVDKQKLERTFFDFLSAFKDKYEKIEIAYSYKTNPLPSVIKILHDFGASAEVISPFELWLALKLGVPPDKIIYNGPAKTEDALRSAISNKIKLINIDGPTEIDLIARLSKMHTHSQQVGVRVVTGVGWASQFGFKIKNGTAFKAFQELVGLQNVDPCGLHLHLGTGIKDIQTYIQAIDEILDFSVQLKK